MSRRDSVRQMARVLSALLLAVSTNCVADVFVVTSFADSGPDTIRQAILDANSTPGADTISLRFQGTYMLATPLPTITEKVFISGWGRQSSIFSGFNAFRPFVIASGVEVDMTNMTIKDAVGSGYGGAIANGGALTLSGVDILNCTASAGGGGVSNSGTLTIEDSNITGCSAPNGGGVYSSGSLLTIENSDIESNIATISSWGGGGGVFSSGDVTITNSTIASNESNSRGGGILVSEATTNMSNSKIELNSSESAGAGAYLIRGSHEFINSTISENTTTSGSGGGIVAVLAPIRMYDSTMFGNSAVNGGAIHLSGGVSEPATLRLQGVTIYDNQASNLGGGISGWTADSMKTVAVFMMRSTISGNTSLGDGGGIHLTNGSWAEIIGCTIVENNAGVNYGGLMLDTVSFTTLASSVFASNGAQTYPNVRILNSRYLKLPNYYNNYNFVEDAEGTEYFNGPENLIGLGDPLLGPLTDNGGPTVTHAPLPGSQLIDAGEDYDSVNSPNETDQRGVARVIGAHADIGAVESGVIIEPASSLLRAVITDLGRESVGLTYGLASLFGPPDLTPAMFDFLDLDDDDILEMWELLTVNVGPVGVVTIVYVDFANESSESGTQSEPFDTLFEAYEYVADDGDVLIEAGTSSESFTLERGLTLSAPDGVVRIGGSDN